MHKLTQMAKKRAKIHFLQIQTLLICSVLLQHRILHAGITEFVADKDDVDKPIDQVNFAALKLIPYLFRGRNTDFTLSKLEVFPASLLNTKYHAAAQKKCLITLDKILHFIKSEVKETNMVYDFHLNAETGEVIVSPLTKIPIKAFSTPWNLPGDIQDQAKS
uniref:Uncharacterized protein n=1 Tax=Tetranychus urticae TaxID=32264 RepID=T1KE42_TETUR